MASCARHSSLTSKQVGTQEQGRADASGRAGPLRPEPCGQHLHTTAASKGSEAGGPEARPPATVENLNLARLTD